MRAAKHRHETYLTPLSRCIMDPDALIGFAHKVSVIRKGQAPGKAMTTFLSTLRPEMLLLAAMMCDAGVEAFALIRFLDSEKVEVADTCTEVENFMEHVQWLFGPEQGVLKIDGHTTFIMQWFRNGVHYLSVNGQLRAFGGSDFTDGQVSQCLAHLSAWVKLVIPCLEAEFPSFGLINAFGAFQLPKNNLPDMQLSDVTLTKLKRLEQAFRKPHLTSEFKSYFPFAVREYAASNFASSYWECWKAACRRGVARLPTVELEVL